jgi:6-phosphogluconolactonase (cycloisomerase 2 family)
MKNHVRLFALLAAGCLCLPLALPAQQYIITNDNISNGTNTASVLKVSATGKVKLLQTYSTGGTSAGGGLFAINAIASAHSGTNTCVFVSNGGNSTISAFTFSPSTGVLTAVSGSPFPDGETGLQSSGIGLAAADNKFLYAGNTAFGTVSALRISSTCALKLIKTFPTAGTPDGMKVTPNGKFLLIAYIGDVDSFQINTSTGMLAELGPFVPQGPASGVEISCDSTTAYFGDAIISGQQVEAFSISSSGQLAELNNFTNSNGSDSNGVELSPDGSTLYVSNTLSSQVSALTTGPNGALTFGTITTLNGSPVFTLNTGFGKSGKNLFVSELNAIGSLAANGTTLTEISGSPFVFIGTEAVPSMITLPGKVCP